MDSTTYLSQLLLNINSQKPIKSVLDVGCRTGVNSDSFRKLYPGHWVGIEPEYSNVEIHNLASKYNFIMVGDVRKFDSSGDRSFNIGFVDDMLLTSLPDEEPYDVWQLVTNMCEFVILTSPKMFTDRHEKILGSFPHIQNYKQGDDNIYVASKWNQIETTKQS